jgi:hypothetical protein
MSKQERPILFSAPMVRAILDGRKTQTRRIVKGVDGNSWIRIKGGYGTHVVDEKALAACPYGVPGDRLWVRETFQIRDTIKGRRILVDQGSEKRNGRHANYRADAENVCRWRPSIHMPRWASRILLEVTDVRVQRLHDISEADACAEGVTPIPQRHRDEFDSAPHRETFVGLWVRINGPSAWGVNPWYRPNRSERTAQRAALER